MDRAKGGDRSTAAPVENGGAGAIFPNRQGQAIRDEQQSSHPRLLFVFGSLVGSGELAA